MKVQLTDESIVVLEDSENLLTGMNVPYVSGNSQYNTIKDFAIANGLFDTNNNLFIPDEISILSKPVTPIATLKEQAYREIDNKAGEIRCKYITNAAGQDATYIAKAEQAKEYITAGYPADLTEYGYIVAEIARLELDQAIPTDRELAANTIISIRNTWMSIDASIEKARLFGKTDVGKRLVESTILAAKNSALAALDLI